MATKLTVLGVHGLGDHRRDPWDERWQAAIRRELPAEVELVFEPFRYDEIFERVEISMTESLTALAKLAGSGLAGGLGGLFGTRRSPASGTAATRGPIDQIQHGLKWYAGYVVGWLEDDEFRAEVRERFLTRLGEVQPDVIAAHSLGSLITYDAITSAADVARHAAAAAHLEHVRYLTLGSQIGNAFVVRNLTPGRIAMPPVARWWHLYNQEDDVFTAPIRMPGEERFQQVLTYFDIEGLADHDAVEYLRHGATRMNVWLPLAMERSESRSLNAAARVQLGPAPQAEPSRGAARPAAPAGRRPRNRALLVGINNYPDPVDRLKGCVNDVFLMSSVLQECGFAADEVRVVLDRRATARGILDRLEWLVDDVIAGDTLVFYYSGHGAQLPTYGLGDQVDRMDETLVPADFDWAPETSITDDQIYRFYSQLPYETRLAMIFDCCHSGGIHRDGGVTVRGLSPPDDIRHRALRWDPALSMWIPRDLPPLNRDFSDDDEARQRYCGASGSLLRLGRAMCLRGQTQAEYAALRQRRRNSEFGPYLPMILEACGEQQFAYEYRHGVQSYGAFTYSLADTLRKAKTITFQQLVKQVGGRLRQLGYEQTPALLGPKALLKANVPWSGDRVESDRRK